MNVLGLDISTTTIGVTVLNENGVVLAIYLKPEGETVFEKVASALHQFDSSVKIPIDYVYAEAPNIMFAKGMSTAQTIAKILRFNGAFLFTLYRRLNILPIEVMAVSARKRVIGIGRFKEKPKEAVFEWVKNNTDIVWPTMKKGKHQGEYSPECFDIADSYIVSKYGLIIEQSRKNQTTK